MTVAAGEHVLTVRYRCRETGMYEGAPFVDEWKPLPPRLHDLRTLERVATIDAPLAVAAAEVSEREFAEFVAATGHRPAVPADATPRGWVARRLTPTPSDRSPRWTSPTRAGMPRGPAARLPTEDEWQLAAAEPGFARLAPAVWNLTESEHSDGRTRFMMFKGGADHRSEGSSWYFDGGRREAGLLGQVPACPDSVWVARRASASGSPGRSTTGVA